jgi:hypothetical protein
MGVWWDTLKDIGLGYRRWTMTNSKTFLQTLTEPEWTTLVPHLSKYVFSVGENILKFGAEARSIVFIEQGCAKVVTCTGLGRDVMTALLLNGYRTWMNSAAAPNCSKWRSPLSTRLAGITGRLLDSESSAPLKRDGRPPGR